MEFLRIVNHLILEPGAEWSQSDPHVPPCHFQSHLSKTNVASYIVTQWSFTRTHLFNWKICQEIVHQHHIGGILRLEHVSGHCEVVEVRPQPSQGGVRRRKCYKGGEVQVSEMIEKFIRHVVGFVELSKVYNWDFLFMNKLCLSQSLNICFVGWDMLKLL